MLSVHQWNTLALINAFRKENGYFPNSNELAKLRGVRRFAVWKTIKILEKGGHITLHDKTKKIISTEMFPFHQ